MVLRSVVVLLGLRAALALGEVTDPKLVTHMALLALVTGAVHLDARRRGEDLVLANLGIPTHAVAFLALAVALGASLFLGLGRLLARSLL